MEKLCVFCQRAFSNRKRLLGIRNLAQIKRGIASSSDRGDKDETPPQSIRNIGIMAHIDAGKTTTTERMLYYAGFIKRMGDVDDGDTVMDYMNQERERGITINSATITFHWNHNRINLIDTPGHVDFTFEVERSLRVLDGAVIVFDGSAGVEAQTMTVWRQTEQYSIPRIAFVNKMDKPGASLTQTVQSMEKKLKTIPLLTQLPLGHGKGLSGILDLLSMDLLVWDRDGEGSAIARIPLATHNPETSEKDFENISSEVFDSELKSAGLSLSIDEALEARYQLAEQVVTLDEQLLETINDDSFSPLSVQEDPLREGIRRLTLAGEATPVLCGSSLKNIGVQPLMDAIISYLPSPIERQIDIPEALRDHLYAYAFKVTHDPRRGPMVYLRLHSGDIKPQTGVYNVSRNINERVTRVLLMLADEQKEVSRIGMGNIAVAVGMKNTYTGDTILESSSVANAAQRELKRSHQDDGSSTTQTVEIGAINIPPPVFFCSVEPASAALQKDLDHALSCLSREDPSLRVSTNKDTGQTVLSGMGELHLEVIHSRLKRDYGVDCSLGKLQVAYKEAPTVAVTETVNIDRLVGNKRINVAMTLTLTPLPHSEDSQPLVELDNEGAIGSNCGEFSREELLTAIKRGVASACIQGPILAFPIQNLQLTVSSLSLNTTTTLPLLSSCISEATHTLLKKSHPQLLEPCTELVVTVPEEHLGPVLSDLSSQRRAQIKEVASLQESRVVTALAPLSCLMGYSTVLRTMTSGTGTFSATFSHYEPVNRELERTIINEIRGYIY